VPNVMVIDIIDLHNMSTVEVMNEDNVGLFGIQCSFI